MPDNKLTEQSAVAAEGIKQLVEQGRKVLSATEQVASLLSRLGPSSPVARAFTEAGIAAQAAGTRSQASAVQQAVQTGIGQVQTASQPKPTFWKNWPGGVANYPLPGGAGGMPPLPESDSGGSGTSQPQSRQKFPQAWASLQASMMQALATGQNPVHAARQPPTGAGSPLATNQWPAGMPGLPLGPNQWPGNMPGLPVGSPGNPAPANMPPLPGAATAAAGAAAGGGLGAGMASLLRVAGLAGVAGAAISNQFYGGFSSGHGMEQFNQESQRSADWQTSLLTRLRAGGDIIAGSTAAQILAPGASAIWEWLRTSVGDGPR